MKKCAIYGTNEMDAANFINKQNNVSQNKINRKIKYSLNLFIPALLFIDSFQGNLRIS